MQTVETPHSIGQLPEALVELRVKRRNVEHERLTDGIAGLRQYLDDIREEVKERESSFLREVQFVEAMVRRITEHTHTHTHTHTHIYIYTERKSLINALALLIPNCTLGFAL